MNISELIIDKVTIYRTSSHRADINSVIDFGISSILCKYITTLKTVAPGNTMIKYATNKAASSLIKASSIGILGGIFTGISGAINLSRYGISEGSGRTIFDVGGLIIAFESVNRKVNIQIKILRQERLLYLLQLLELMQAQVM